MKPAPFTYVAPTTLDEALAYLQAHGWEAKILAGGQSLIPVMNFRLAQPAALVDINRLPELSFVHEADDGGLRLGAMARHSRLEHSPLVAARAPLLHEAMPYIAHPQIRNRGTLGGSLAHADPAAELPVICVALEARFRLRRQDQERWVAATAFYEGLFTTALAPEEILVEVAIPPQPPGTGHAFLELARRHGDYAQAGVAALVTLDTDGVCRRARLVFLNLGEVPTVADATAALIGEQPADALIDHVVHQATTAEIAPTGDIHATADYKRHLAAVLARRALRRARERAGTGQV